MNITQVEENLTRLVKNFSEKTFIHDLLLAYGLPKNTITLLKKGSRNLSSRHDQIILKKKLFFQEARGQNLHRVIGTLQNDNSTHRHDPRFIAVTDYKTLLAIDIKTKETLDIDIKAINKHFDFFLPWAGMEKSQHKNEAPADVKAAERMAKIYDEILKDNKFSSHDELHSLNIFLSRLLFCFFAEDTGIFGDGVFTNSISSHTQADGSDLDKYLNKLFKILNTKDEDRGAYSEYLKVFPYVNGGLFGEKYYSPKFSHKSRKLIIESGELDWSGINPDIFGSMIQAVVHPDKRGGLGMHYTSVPNIMKVIEPLFLNELRSEFEKYNNNVNKLEQLLARLTRLRIFDPACGSGNFLIIAYKEIRKLEMKIFKRLQKINPQMSLPLSWISLSQFYGIELDDFACEVAVLALWLTEHQMNVLFKETFGQASPSLPLKESGNIICGNATRLDWEAACPKDENSEVYILGNPPYLGSFLQNKVQKEDLALLCKGFRSYKDLDYICCWFLKAVSYVKCFSHSKVAFVSTNSICQGEQVALLWPHIFNAGLEIFFAHQSFKWTNNAKGNAGVTCAIVGLRNISNDKKYLINGTTVQAVSSISPYLSQGDNIIVTKRSKPLSKIPKMSYGNKIVDDGHLILSTQEKRELVNVYPRASRLIKRLIGSAEFIKGQERWVLWIKDKDLPFANSIPEIKKRLDSVAAFRLKSSEKSTREMADYPNKYYFTSHQDTESMIIPSTSSERRDYIPIGFLDGSAIISNAAHVVYDVKPFIFGIISSRMHMTWVRAIAGRLKTDYRYSSGCCYNTFPIPELTEKQKENITMHVYNVLEERERNPEKSLAELYDPEKMPYRLRQAHNNLDRAVDRCYRSKPFATDEARLEYLFELYKEMNSKEKQEDYCEVIINSLKRVSA